MTCQLYKKQSLVVEGLHRPTLVQDVLEYFSKFGDVVRIRHCGLDYKGSSLNSYIMETPVGQALPGPTQPVKECPIVEFKSVQSVKDAVHHKEHVINGQKVVCKLAMTNNEKKQY